MLQGKRKWTRRVDGKKFRNERGRTRRSGQVEGKVKSKNLNKFKERRKAYKGYLMGGGT